MLDINRKMCVHERERGTSNSGEQKNKKCNGEKNFLSDFISLLVIIRGTKRTYLYIKIWRERRKRNKSTNKEEMRKVKGL